MCKEYNEYRKTRLWKSCGRSVHFLWTSGHEIFFFASERPTIVREPGCGDPFAGRFA
jgi:hypothetical protein